MACGVLSLFWIQRDTLLLVCCSCVCVFWKTPEGGGISRNLTNTHTQNWPAPVFELILTSVVMLTKQTTKSGVCVFAAHVLPTSSASRMPEA